MSHNWEPEVQRGPQGQMASRPGHRPRSAELDPRPLPRRLRTAAPFLAQPRPHHRVFKFETCFFSRPKVLTSGG